MYLLSGRPGSEPKSDTEIYIYLFIEQLQINTGVDITINAGVDITINIDIGKDS